MYVLAFVVDEYIYVQYMCTKYSWILKTIEKYSLENIQPVDRKS